MENMEKVVLEKRKVVGKKNKKLLSEGYIPTVIYNSEGNSRNIKIPYSVAVKIVRHPF